MASRPGSSQLSANYKENPWIVAGDFNITTSAFTIDEALKTDSVSAQAVTAMSSIESLLAEAGLSDSWRVARTLIWEARGTTLENSFGDLHDGEEGATFDPTNNPLASATAGLGPSARPQR